jgi:hypothetical protein
MKLTTLPVSLPVLLTVAIFGGCATPPAAKAPLTASAPAGPAAPAGEKQTEKVTAPQLPVPAFAPAAETGKASAETTAGPALSAEAAEFVARFTQSAGGDAQPHKLSDSTSFPDAISSLQPGAKAPKLEFVPNVRPVAPVQGLTADGTSTQLIVRDWTGLVLVPVSTSLSIAHTSSVRLLKVEAHPLSDGRVRIWVRVQNVARTNLMSEVACSFQMQSGKTTSSPYFYELPVPSSDFRDVFFVSPEGKLSSYTVLVRQGH